MIIHHGGGGHEAHWLTQGVANRILDNVLAAGRMQPAVVIFPNINGIAGGQTGLTNDLMNNILPFVEANYNVAKKPSDRAVGGLSLGGLRTNELLFNRTSSFGYYGVWSNAGSVPAANSPLLLNPELKQVLGAAYERWPAGPDPVADDQPAGPPGGQRHPARRRQLRRRARMARLAAEPARVREQGRVPGDEDRGQRRGPPGSR